MNIQMIRTKSKEPKKKSFFCSHLNIEHITDADYAYAKRVCKDFEIKKLEEYHELYFRILKLEILEFNQYQKSDKVPLLFMQILNV